MKTRSADFVSSSRPQAAAAFRKYAPDLHRYIARRTRRPSAAPDLTQDVFERFLLVKDADAVRNPQAYLFGIASHVVREALFREDRSLVTFDSDIAEHAEENLPSGAQDALEERLALRQELRAALMRLPLAHRAVLLLIKRDGLSYEEAAEKLHLSVNTVTSYLFEARARVKTFLEESSGAKAK